MSTMIAGPCIRGLICVRKAFAWLEAQSEKILIRGIDVAAGVGAGLVLGGERCVRG